ncbi:class I adenylate-forming enzyme family protein [Aquabacterium sp. J223]|uniref:class I adenylate-forming enzyme family protein n=1 Tax=Aquabacterium sp. J223 TaxID=2898431 RepID=UPI0021AD582B|nr:AMP-binding protein [Aquabacterium sp. J223]UUX95207.1 AMP-binding protein [Aquabacterium sp. J223]
MNAADIVGEAIAERGVADKAALVEDGQAQLTYAELAQRLDRAAAVLQAAGLGPGERLAIVSENSADAVVLLLAALRAGGWAVPINARMAAGEVDGILAHARPRLAYFASGSSAEAHGHALRTGAPAADPADWVGGHLARFDDGVQAEDEPGVALMLYTGGSTGLPKGVMLTHDNLDFVTRVSMQQAVLLREDRLFHALPISHSFGLISALLCGLRAGATVRLVRRFSAEGLARAILDDGITVFQGVPGMYARLQEWSLASGTPLRPHRLRLAYIGGAQIDATRKAQSEALLGLPLHHGYGMTECAPVAVRTIGHPPPKTVTCGWPIPGVDVQLRDEAGRPVPPGGHGEVWIRGPNVMRGYFRDPEQTRAAVDAEGWLHTGDIGEFGPDGDLSIVGRRKEMIIRGGFNVYPAEVERAIAAFPGVGQCAVVGRPVDDDEEVVAFVEPVAGQAVDLAALRQHLREQLAPYKRPAAIVVLDALPANTTGKVLKPRLKAMAMELAMDTAPTRRGAR